MKKNIKKKIILSDNKKLSEKAFNGVLKSINDFVAVIHGGNYEPGSIEVKLALDLDLALFFYYARMRKEEIH